MAVVEIDGFESGRLSVKVSLGGGRGPNSAMLRVNVRLATDDVVWVLLRDVVWEFGGLGVGEASAMIGCESSTIDWGEG